MSLCLRNNNKGDKRSPLPPHSLWWFHEGIDGSTTMRSRTNAQLYQVSRFIILVHFPSHPMIFMIPQQKYAISFWKHILLWMKRAHYMPATFHTLRYRHAHYHLMRALRDTGSSWDISQWNGLLLHFSISLYKYEHLLISYITSIGNRLWNSFYILAHFSLNITESLISSLPATTFFR